MNRHVASGLLLGLLVIAGAAASAGGADAPLVRVSSPNGQARIEVVLERHKEAEAVPHWRVFFKDKPIVRTSRLGMDLAEDRALGGACVIETVETHARHAAYD